eukprot:scaffold10297_cov54-Phaeocystis_antarctica.AAC.1
MSHDSVTTLDSCCILQREGEFQSLYSSLSPNTANRPRYSPIGDRSAPRARNCRHKVVCTLLAPNGSSDCRPGSSLAAHRRASTGQA